MTCQPFAAAVGVHVEGMLGETRDGRPGQRTARREYQPVIGKISDGTAVRQLYRHHATTAVDAGRPALDTAHPDRPKHCIQSHTHRSKVSFVAADADHVERIRVHQDHFRSARYTKLFKRARSAGRSPKACKAATNNENAWHHTHPLPPFCL